MNLKVPLILAGGGAALVSLRSVLLTQARAAAFAAGLFNWPTPQYAELKGLAALAFALAGITGIAWAQSVESTWMRRLAALICLAAAIAAIVAAVQ